jgi:hypothetical protein
MGERGEILIEDSIDVFPKTGFESQCIFNLK